MRTKSRRESAQPAGFRQPPRRFPSPVVRSNRGEGPYAGEGTGGMGLGEKQENESIGTGTGWTERTSAGQRAWRKGFFIGTTGLSAGEGAI